MATNPPRSIQFPPAQTGAAPWLPLAIVSMDCRLPGADNLEAYERLLFEGRQGFGVMPADRFDAELYFDSEKGQPGKTYTTLGGCVTPRQPDLQALGLSPELAARIDPVHLNFCEVAVRAWRRSGLDQSSQPLRDVGIFVGHSGATRQGGPLNLASHIDEGLDFLNEVSLYSELPASIRQQMLAMVARRIRASRPFRSPDSLPRLNAYTAASLPAEILGLTGPRFVCDAACASSLFSMQQAALAIQFGRIQAAIVGGATTNGVDNLILFSQSQACSATDSCPFDQNASGLISSEGYAAVVVLPLQEAQRRRLPILGVITGLGTSSDGRGKSLWAPRAEGQQLAIRRAYPAQNPLHIDYLEAHATSTQLGDATELQAVQSILGSEAGKDSLLIGSAKSNLGHTLETAGIAGLVKILLAFRRGEIPASLGFESPNQDFDWEQGKIQVVARRRPWPAGSRSRRSAVSAFGIGGLNAHLVVSQQADDQVIAAPAVFPTSLKSEPIAIVGRGVVLPGAFNLGQFQALLASGQSMIGPAPADRWRPGTGLHQGRGPRAYAAQTNSGGFIRNYNFDVQQFRIPPKQMQQSNPIQLMLLDAVTQAIGEADGGQWNFDRQRAGVVVGTIFGGDFGTQLQLGLRLPEISRELRAEMTAHGVPAARQAAILKEYRQRVLKARPALLDETGSFTASTLASRMAKTFDLMGGACAIDVDNASGVAALQMCADQLRLGKWDVALCGAAERCMDLTRFEQLSFTDELVQSGRAEDIPEDLRQVLPGEGVVVLILKRLSDALAQGAPLYGIIEDITQANASPLPPGPRPRQDDAGLVRQIGYLNGAQSLVRIVKQTVLWDSESKVPGKTALAGCQTLNIVSRTEDDLNYQLRLSAPRHTINAVPTVPTSEKPVSAGPSSPSMRTSSPSEASPEPRRKPHLSATDPHSDMATIKTAAAGLTASRLFRFSSRHDNQFEARLQQVLANPAGEFSAPEACFTQQDCQRATVLAESPDQLTTRVKALLRQWHAGRRNGVFETERSILWRARSQAVRTAWCFPGQGSQYTGEPASVRDSSVVQQALQQFDAALQQQGLAPLLPALSRMNELQHDVWWNQAWVLGLSLAMAEDVRQLLGPPDVVLGHSFGEYPALVTAGVLTPEQVVRMVKCRADAVVMLVRNPGQLISVRGRPGEVEALLRTAGVPAVTTHYNAPCQTVIAVDTGDTEVVRHRLNNAGMASVVVPVPVAYHTPRLFEAGQMLQQNFQGERFFPARCGVISTSTVRYLVEPDDLRTNLVQQMTHPVLYVPVIERLLKDDVGVLIETGPNQILSRLNHEIIGDRALCLSYDIPGRPHSERLQLLQAVREISAPAQGVSSQNLPASATLRQHSAFAVPGATHPATSAPAAPVAPPEVEIIDLRKPSRQNGAPSPAAPRARPANRAAPTGPGVSPSTLPVPHNGLAASASVTSRLDVSALTSPGSAEVAAEVTADKEELLQFLKTVVVDLTGYKPEVIDFDADLEADLGVDSIKKAQVVGEMAEHYELNVAPSGVKLSDLTTLNHIAELGATALQSQSAGHCSAGAGHCSADDRNGKAHPAATPLSDSAPATQPTTPPATHSPLNPALAEIAPAGPVSGPAPGSVGGNHTSAGQMLQTTAAAQMPASAPSLENSDADGAPYFDLESVQQFLVDLVVDQTGYSPDVLDLDADMEADLGIDSIKQAQLLGEVQQQFEIQYVPGKKNSLSSFSTLRSILNYLAEVIPQNGSTSFRVSVPENGSLHADSPAADETGDVLKKNGSESLVSGLKSAQTNGHHAAVPPGSNGMALHREGTGKVRGLAPDDTIPDDWKALFVRQSPTQAPDAWQQGRRRGAEHRQIVRAALRLLNDLLPEPGGSAPPDQTGHEPDEELAGLAAGAGVTYESVRFASAHFHRAQAESPVQVPSRPVEDDSLSTDAPASAEVRPVPRLADLTGHEMPTGEHSLRCLLRMVPAPQRERMPAAPHLTGPGLVLGDSAYAREIIRRFEECGQPCYQVPATASLAELDAALERIWSKSATPHLFLAPSHDAEALRSIDARHWQTRRYQALEVPYRVCQLWMQRSIDAGSIDGGSVVLLTNLGGDFGFSGSTAVSPEGGLAGLIKAMLIECWMRGYRATPMKVIDISAETTPAQAVRGIWRELAVPSYDMEVACHGDERYVVQPIFRPLDASLEIRPTAPETTHIRKGGVWVVTGGARGITSFVVRELAKRHQLRLHLVGTAPVPQLTDDIRTAAQRNRLNLRRKVMRQANQRNQNGMEAWRNMEKAIEIDATLQQFRDEGITVSYHSCDVSRLDCLQETLTEIRNLSGPIQGVIHGAGIGQDARFDRKRPDKVDQCLRAKIDGCLNLMDLTRDDPLEWFVSFGSISGRFGANGHTDYSLANDSLAKLTDCYRQMRPEVRSVTFHWHAWGDIGMATKPETKLALEMINLEFMPAREGLAHFLNELEQGGEEPEVLITDRNYFRKFFPVDRLVNETSAVTRDWSTFPLLDPEGTGRNAQAPFSVELDPRQERFLNQHLVQGKPTLPFVVALEMLCESARRTSRQATVLEVRNLTATQALKWSTETPREVRVNCESAGSGLGAGLWHCELRADQHRRDGRLVAKDRMHFQGEFELAAEPVQRRMARPDISNANWQPIVYLEPEAPVYHGPDLQCLRRIALQPGAAIGEISASSTVQLGGGQRPTFGWSVNCAAMDACLYAAALFAGHRSGKPSLPVSFGRIRFGRLPDPGEPCLVQIQWVKDSPQGMVLTFQLIGLNGDLLLDVHDYLVGWLSLP